MQAPADAFANGPLRSQLSLFVPPIIGGDTRVDIEAIRCIVDPVQHRLIPAHVTLCREDELTGIVLADCAARLDHTRSISRWRIRGSCRVTPNCSMPVDVVMPILHDEDMAVAIPGLHHAPPRHRQHSIADPPRFAAAVQEQPTNRGRILAEEQP